MRIGKCIRAIRKAKALSPDDLEKRSGLYRNYITRVENGNVIPSVEMLEKIAHGLEVPLYQIIFKELGLPTMVDFSGIKGDASAPSGTSRKEVLFWKKLRGLIACMKEPERRLLLRFAQKIARR